MDIALDSNNKRIKINKASKLQNYHCIVCGSRVDVNQGSKRSFFSHAKGLGEDCELKLNLLLDAEKKDKNEKIIILEKEKLKSKLEQGKIEKANKLKLILEERLNNINNLLSQFNFTDKQKVVIDLFLEGLNTNFKYKKTIVISGKAGTGKTFLLSILSKLTDIYNKDYVVSAYTGKAVEVLKSKDIDKSATVHSTMYKPKTNSKGDIIGWTKNIYLDFDVWFIDEFSMLNKDIIKDILDYRIPCIFTGDIKQLPPIGEKSNHLENIIDIELDEVLRQAKGSYIIEKANFVREDNDLELKTYKLENEHGMFGMINNNHHQLDTIIKKSTQMICGTNNTRHKLNRKYRELHNFNDLLIVGEKLMIQRNNKDIGVFNGQIVTILELGRIGIDIIGLKIQEVTTDMGKFNICLNCIENESFNFTDYLSKHKIYNYTYPVFVQYAYCATIYKLQGSSSETCLVFMNDMYWMKKQEHFYRGLYTSITRAIKNCIIVY